jgi:hypothetical protein
MHVVSYKMPRKAMDYSRTVIYKLVCVDVDISNCYVGHTTDFVKRKSSHKSVCNNPDHKSYNCDVYVFIRNNGGFDNWNMIEIEKYPCSDVFEACNRERYYIELLKATLNKIRPTVTATEQKEHNKECCQKYRNDHKEYFRSYNQKYYENKDNKDAYLQYQEEYRKNNIDKLRTKVSCLCGGSFQHQNKAHHFKTKRHINYKASQKNNN